MTRDARVYRLLLLGYPRAFRTDFGDDMVQLFGDLMRRDGRRAAWRRSLADAAVSVPCLRLESVMHPDRVAPSITALAALVAAAGVVALTLGGAAGAPVLALAALLAVSQRSRFGRALSVTPSRRRERLRTAALLGTVFAAAVISWLFQVNRGTELGPGITLVHNLVGFVSLVGALGYLGAALVTGQGTGAPGDRSA